MHSPLACLLSIFPPIYVLSVLICIDYCSTDTLFVVFNLYELFLFLLVLFFGIFISIIYVRFILVIGSLIARISNHRKHATFSLFSS